MKKIALTLVLALGLGACSADQTERGLNTLATACVVENIAYNTYLAFAADSPTKLERARKAHLLVVALCEAGAAIEEINRAKAMAEAERAKK